MADVTEYDSREGNSRLRVFASRLKDIQAELYSIANSYTNKFPKSERDEAEYRAGMLKKLAPELSALKSLMNDLD